MKVTRIVTDIAADDVGAAKRFYGDVLGLEVLMDQGWIATYGSNEQMKVQISFASQGRSDAPFPDISIEVDDLDAALKLAPACRRPSKSHPAASPVGSMKTARSPNSSEDSSWTECDTLGVPRCSRT